MGSNHKVFPKYFENFEMPEGAREENIIVYRACATGNIDHLSFIPSFEENNFQYKSEDDPKDPSVYSLSTYWKPKDVKRFAAMTSSFKVPYKIAKGVTEPSCGLTQRTKERKNLKIHMLIGGCMKMLNHTNTLI